MAGYDITENVAIAAISLHRPDMPGYEVRPKLAVEFLKEAVDLGYKPVVVDGGSVDEFLERVDGIKGVELSIDPQEIKYKSGPNRRSAIRKAYETGRKVIALTELEKFGFLEFLEFTAEPILEDKADMIIPGRTSLESYPKIQAMLERFLNREWKKYTEIEVDISFGPRVFGRGTSRYFTDYDGRYGDMWESSFIPVFDYIIDNIWIPKLIDNPGKAENNKNLRIKGMDFLYEHPEEQASNENGNRSVFLRKWARQYWNILSSLSEHRKLNSSGFLKKY